jgi:hypothetical protein
LALKLELELELERERRLIEAHLADANGALLSNRITS